MNFSTMDYFVVLVQERNFTRAAERLHITQQTLSSHIAGLEKELGCQLLVRRVPLELTYAGEVFLRYATEFHQSFETMQREFADIAGNARGVLRVGVAATRGQTVLLPVIAAFQGRYPGITVELTEGSNEALLQGLTEGELDLAVADFPEVLSGVELREFYQEELAFVCRRDEFAQWFGEDAAEVGCRVREGDLSVLRDVPVVLGGEEDSDGRLARQLLRQAGVDRPRVQAMSHNVGSLLLLAARGVGACFCPENLVRGMLSEEQAAELLIAPLGRDAAYDIRFGYRARSYQWRVLDAFMTAAKELAEE